MSRTVGPAEPHPWYAAWVLGLLLLAYVLSFVDRQLLSLLVGPVRRDLGIGDFQFSLISGWAFAIFYTVMGIPIGKLADTGNRRRLIAVGIALWSLMTALCGLAKSFSTLFLARIGVGVGEAALSPPTYSLLSDYFPPRQLPRAMAIYTLGITLGGGLAYLVGGFVVGLVAGIDAVSWPLLGTLRPWQLAFLVVGLAGLPVALLMLSIREPRRRMDDASATTEEPQQWSLAAILRQTWRRRSDYAIVLYVVPLLSVVGYAFLSWYPEFLIRSYGLERSQAGYTTGWLYLVAGSIGTLGGAWLAGRLAAAGMADANGRLVALVAVALPLPAVLTPLMPTAALSVLCAVPTMLLLNAYFGVSLAALQLITPNRARARLSAVLLLANNLLGLGFGTSLVAALTQYYFAADVALGKSIAVIALLFSLPAAIIAWRSLSGYRRAVERLRSPA